ncbi:MAG: MBL fold metallo-hydrolase [Clostridia bacterium]|nr:MBL fold metallo-hydrolase [Clostridia bacterium]
MIQYKCFITGGMETNTYLVWCGASAVVIDPGAKSTALASFISGQGLSVCAVLLTHGHFDHIGGVSAFSCPVYACGAETALLQNPALNLSAYFGLPETITDSIPVQEGDVIDLEPLSFSVLHTPGHTAGSVCYQIGGLLFTGDTLFCGGAGRTDFPTGNSAALHRSLNRLITLNGEWRVLPGHGEETLLSRERAHNPFVC